MSISLPSGLNSTVAGLTFNVIALGVVGATLAQWIQGHNVSPEQLSAFFALVGVYVNLPGSPKAGAAGSPLAGG